MSVSDNLHRAKVVMGGANIATALLMITAYILLPNFENRIWFLVAGILFIIAAIALFIFVGRLQKKLDL